jgi:phosphopantetheine--protein transferase-like protein
VDVIAMESSTLLRKTVAEFFEVDEGSIGPSFSLQSRQGSIARAALDAAIRGRVGVKSIAVYSAKTFGELEAEIAPGSGSSPSPAIASASSTVAPSIAVSAGSGASCGVDLELVANLPVPLDPWEDPFYQANFTASEIAYCLRQLDPPTHFAARWCAKEALKKCDRAFLAVAPKLIEVVLDEAGAPRLEYLGEGTAKRLPHAVSLSHTTLAAIAVVVRADPAPGLAPAPAPILVPSAPAPGPVVVAPVAPRVSRGLLILNLVVLVVSVVALLRTFSMFRWPFSG